MKHLLELMLESHPPGRLWILEQTRVRAAQDLANLSLRALMLLGPLVCH